eukprot:GHVQ01002948.1.p1 GENE.GHVQ01002948.1~~GHVQ01002948.1.p1  ORF type:complete len:494 (-),score=165.26 GHVQ01002948.1:363-1844(-)
MSLVGSLYGSVNTSTRHVSGSSSLSSTLNSSSSPLSVCSSTAPKLPLLSASSWSTARAKLLAPPVLRRQRSTASSATSSSVLSAAASGPPTVSQTLTPPQGFSNLHGQSSPLSNAAGGLGGGGGGGGGEESLEPINKKLKTLLSSIAQASQAASSLLGPSVSLSGGSGGTGGGLQVVIDEYDCAKPNDFEAILKRRKRRQQEKEMEQQRRKQTQQDQMDRERAEQQELLATAAGAAAGCAAAAAVVGGGAAVVGGGAAVAGGGGAAGAALALKVSGQEAWARRAHLGGGNVESVENEDSGGGKLKTNFAARMMEKMGWKHGEGLGREKQGITAPLVARKTDTRSGVIVKGATKHAPVTSAAVGVGPAVGGGGGGNSRVVMLTNLVGRGEVDEDVQGETEEEAAKYGNLLKVLIVVVDEEVGKLSEESRGGNVIGKGEAVGDDEAVRIFCEYESKMQAEVAYRSLDGRKFGSRMVKARYYDESRYNANDLLMRF